MFRDRTPHPPAARRLRVRLPQRSDRAALAALLDRLGVTAEPLDLARLLHFEPRREIVVCATSWIDGAELLVGVGGIERGADEPHLLVADERSVPGASAHLSSALRERAGRVATSAAG